MSKNYLPTKNNLLKLRKTIKEYKNGVILLEEKEFILKNKIEKNIKEKNNIIKKINNMMEDAEESVKKSIVDVGLDELFDITNAISKENSIDIKYITIMGVEVPSIIMGESEFELNYGFYNTTMDVDESIIKFRELKKYIIHLAELENNILCLENAIEKIKRRINALRDVIIPRDERLANKIVDIIEENERDELIRLKVCKKNIK